MSARQKTHVKLRLTIQKIVFAAAGAGWLLIKAWLGRPHAGRAFKRVLADGASCAILHSPHPCGSRVPLENPHAPRAIRPACGGVPCGAQKIGGAQTGDRRLQPHACKRVSFRPVKAALCLYRPPPLSCLFDWRRPCQPCGLFPIFFRSSAHSTGVREFPSAFSQPDEQLAELQKIKLKIKAKPNFKRNSVTPRERGGPAPLLSRINLPAAFYPDSADTPPASAPSSV